MSAFLPAACGFWRTPAQSGRAGFAGCSAAPTRAYVSPMAGALSRFPAWFSKTVTLPLLPGLTLFGSGRVFSLHRLAMGEGGSNGFADAMLKSRAQGASKRLSPGKDDARENAAKT